MSDYDAVLILSFGGPEKPEDVLPFLENVLRGKRVPRERMLEVAEHYYHFGGRSPINDQVAALRGALERLLEAEGPRLPVYVGNRNWHPLLADTLRRMAGDGVRRALAFITSAFGSHSGCRQYLDNIDDARREVGESAPRIDRLRVFYNHPDFLETMAESVRNAVSQLPEAQRKGAEIIFTAHSIPVSMALTSPYEAQLKEAAALVAGMAQQARYSLVYQSRSGPPDQAWLEPDVRDYLRQVVRAADAPTAAVLTPLGFLSDHLEVLWDLDHDARGVCDQLGLPVVRAATVGAHPRFVRMIRELIWERLDAGVPRRVLGASSPCPDTCPADCCPSPGQRR